MGSAAQRAGHPARRQEQRREPLLCRVRPGAGPSLSEGRGVPSALGASQLLSSVRWGSAACHGPGRCPRGGGSKVALCRRKGVPLLRPSPNPSSLPFHGTRTSPEPVAPGAGFLAVGERRRGGLSENPALEASSSQARPRKALTPSLTRRAPVRGGARPGGFGGCHTVVRNLKGTAALPYQTNSWHTEQKVGWGKKVAVNSWHLTWCTLACLMAPRRWCRAKRPSVSNSLASFASAEEQRGRS